MKRLKTLLLLLLAIVAGSMQAQDGWTPTPEPPEPYTMYKVLVQATPADKASASGTGRYKQGTSVYINCSARDTDYEFKHWLKNGVQYSTSRNFYYTVTAEDVTFTAVYELINFDPTNPAEPNMDYKRRLYLAASPEEACSFNLNNGSRHSNEEWVTVRAYPSQGFIFLGWYEDNTLLANSLSFNYQMPAEDAHLTARFRFDPDSPNDPFSTGQTNVDQGLRGDVNGDGTVDATDATHIINSFLSGSAYDRTCDLNNDGTVDATDATAIVNIYLDK